MGENSFPMMQIVTLKSSNIILLCRVLETLAMFFFCHPRSLACSLPLIPVICLGWESRLTPGPSAVVFVVWPQGCFLDATAPVLSQRADGFPPSPVHTARISQNISALEPWQPSSCEGSLRMIPQGRPEPER